MESRGKRKREERKPETVPVQAVQTSPVRGAGGGLYRQGGSGPEERNLYRALRDSVPIVDAALGKLIRLAGGFQVYCADRNLQAKLDRFLRTVQVNGAQQGVQSFLDVYLEQLLLYGTAVGEMVLSPSGSIAALYNASLDDIELRQDSPLELNVYRWEKGEYKPLPWPDLILTAAMRPEAGSGFGVSLLRGLPFVSEILLKIYHTIGVNWERVGDVRFAVTYKPGTESDRAFARERASQIAGEWKRAMSSDVPADFVAVGDVSIQTIGADGQILSSEVPVRQMLEQIVAKLGLPPFLLGLSWSSTERMSSQQADILTSELEAYRRLLEPTLRKICDLWFRLEGYPPAYGLEWDEITLQDETETAQARLANAQALRLEQSMERKEEEDK